MSIKYRAHELAEQLRHMPRNESDLEAARMLVKLVEVFEVAREVVMAKTHEHRNAAYAELTDLIKGKAE